MAPNTTAGGSADHPESEMNSGSQKRSCDEESPRARKIFREEYEELQKDLELSDDDSDNDSDSSCNSSCSCHDCSTCDSDSSSDDDGDESRIESSSLVAGPNECSLERNSVDKSPGERDKFKDPERLFKDLELFDDDADGNFRRSFSGISRYFSDSSNSSSDYDDSSSDSSSSDDEDSGSDSETLRVTSSSSSTSSSSDEDSEEELDEDTLLVMNLKFLNLAFLKIDSIQKPCSDIRKYLLLTRIKDRVLESIQVIL